MSSGGQEREHELAELLREVRALRQTLEQLKGGSAAPTALPPGYEVLVRTRPTLPPEYNVAVRVRPTLPPDYEVAVRPALPPDYAVAVRIPRPGEQVISPEAGEAPVDQ